MKQAKRYRAKNQKFDRVVSVKFTEAQVNELTKRAEDECVSLSCYIRLKALGKLK